MRRWIAAAVPAALAMAFTTRAADEGSPFRYCPIVDGGREEFAAFSIGIAPDEAIEGVAEDFGFVEWQARVSLGYYRTSSGDIDLSLGGRMWTPTDGTGFGLPSSFGEGYLRARWDLRTTQGLTLRAEVFPGYYGGSSEMEWDNFNVPFAMSGIQSFGREVAVQGGFRVHPGYAFDPIVGVRWAPHRDVVIDAAYPETRAFWRLHPAVALLAGYQINRMWRFSLDDDDPGGDLMMHDHRLYAGANVTVGGLMTFTARFGSLLHRTIDYTHGPLPEGDIDDGYFFSFGIIGEF